MKMPKLEELNSARFLNEAFEPDFHDALMRGSRIRRNVYLALFLIGFGCIFIAALNQRMTLSILSLFLSTVSLVVMSKYDTQLFFLKILRMREEDRGETGN
ncbi:hypothetical protein [Pontiella sulfatireligans]|uniref:Uncharacterized protein n=1 Tax=Pontiella sulfatireligans TaxID=2750658 RepID=A0A6C2UN37_9BACT|nr:hypothetical protein [Pontiella sulfatireligans]VGO21690.1 hypothetical protein SCARR_03764 [Pontiella sulfatireligans]